MTFKPAAGFNIKDKVATHGCKGSMFSTEANLGGSWTEDYFVAGLKHFEVGSEPKTAKTVGRYESMRLLCQIAKAKVLARKI